MDNQYQNTQNLSTNVTPNQQGTGVPLPSSVFVPQVASNEQVMAPVEAPVLPEASSLEQSPTTAPGTITPQPVNSNLTPQIPGDRPNPKTSLEPPRTGISKRLLIIGGIALVIVLLVVLLAGLISKKNAAKLQSPAQSVSEQGITLGSSTTDTLNVLQLKGSHDKLIVNGDVISTGRLTMASGSYFGQFVTNNLSQNREYLLPDASGTICLDVNNCNFAKAGGVVSSINGVAGAISVGSGLTIQGNTIINSQTPTTVNGFNGNVVVQGTTNQVLVSSAGGVITLATPQDIAITSSPTFSSINISGNTTTINNIAYTWPVSQVNGVLVNDGSGGLTWSAIAAACPTCFVNGGNSFGGNATLGTNDNFSLAFETNGISRVFLDTTGNVGISSASNGAKLYVPYQTGDIGGVPGTTLFGGTALAQIGDYSNTNNNLIAIDGESYSGIGVQGISSTGIGVAGYSNGSGGGYFSAGVFGYDPNSGGAGVMGLGGLFGVGDGIGVAGYSGTSYGIFGQSSNGISGFFQSTCTGLFGCSGSSALPTLVTQQYSSSTADLFQARDSSSNARFAIGYNGHTGIGNLNNAAIDDCSLVLTTCYADLNIQEGVTDFSRANNYGINNFMVLSPSADTSNAVAGINNNIATDINAFNYSTIRGNLTTVAHSGTGGIAFAEANHLTTVNYSSGTIAFAKGTQSDVVNAGSGSIGSATGLDADAYNFSTGTIGTTTGIGVNSGNLGSGAVTTNYGINIATGSSGSGGLTDNYGINIQTAAHTGTITNNYGLYIQDQSAASVTSYNLYSAGTGTNYFGGNIVAATLGAADTSTYLCRNSSNQIAACNSTGAGAAFVQGGNSFGATATLGTNDNNSLNIRTNGTTRIAVDTSGGVTVRNQLAVGSTASIASNTTLSIAETSTATSGNIYGSNNVLNYNPSGATTAVVYGGVNQITTPAGNAQNISAIVGGQGRVDHSGTGTISSAYGQYGYVGGGVGSGAITTALGSIGQVDNFSSSTYTQSAGVYGIAKNGAGGSITTAYGVFGNVANASTGSIGSAYNFSSLLQNTNASGTITTAAGFYAQNPSNSGTITTNYGILVDPQTAGVSDYGVAIGAADTQTLWVSSNADNTTASAGIAFGSSRDLTLYRSAANTLMVTGHVLPSATLTYDLGSDTNRWRDLYVGPATVHIGASGNEYGISYDTVGSALQFNSGLADRDIKISGTSQANLLYVDAGNNRVGVGTATPGYTLEVNGTFNAATSVAVGGVNVCISSGCTVNPTSGFVQGGNAFGAAAVLGTTDANDLQIKVNGTNTFTFNAGSGGSFQSNGYQFRGSSTLNNASAPAYAFTGASNTGLYNPTGTALGVAVNGSEVARFSGSTLEVASSGTPGTVEKFRVNTPTTVDNSANTILSASAATSKPLVVQGFASQSANLQEWQSSAGSVLAKVSSAGAISSPTFNATPTGSSTYSLYFTPTDTNMVRNAAYWGSSVAYGISLEPVNTSASQYANGFGVRIGNAFSSGVTTGNYDILRIYENNFNPASGASQMNGISINPIINQSGTASGITRGIYISPTLTSAVDFRGIEIANTSGKGLWQSGSSVPNYFAGNVGIGSSGTAGTVEKLRVNTPTTVDNLAASILSTGATTSKGLVVQGVASQTANLQEWQDSTGATKLYVGKTGSFGAVTIGADAATNSSALVLKYAQTLTYLTAADSGNSSLLTIDNTVDPTWKNLIVKAKAAQTADLVQFQNSAGTNLLSVTSAGALQGNNGSGTNVAGSNITINGGQGTGTGVGGNIVFQYAPGGTSGSSLNALQTACSISGSTGSLSCPGAGASSERFGAGATAAGASSVALGNGASAPASSSIAIGLSAVTPSSGGVGSVAIGNSASVSGTGAGSVVIGYTASSAGSGNVIIGATATASAATFNNAVAIGIGASTSLRGTVVGAASVVGQDAVAIGSNITTNNTWSVAIGGGAATGGTSAIAIGISASAPSANSIAIGANMATTAGAQLVVGPITTAYLGNGVTNATPNSISINATGGSGTNIAGASLTLAGGRGTGTGNGGDINLQVAKPGTSGSSANSLATVATFSGINGAATLQNSADSATALQVKNAAGSTTVLDVDTTNTRVGIGTNAPGALLELSQTNQGPNYGLRITQSSVSVNQYIGSGASYYLDIPTNTRFQIGNPATGTGTGAIYAGRYLTLATWNGSNLGGVKLTNNGTDVLTLQGSDNNLYFGNGVTSATPTGQKLIATGGSGTNIAGASLTLAGGKGTGTGNGGDIVFQYAPAGSTGSTANTLTTACTISGTNGSLSCPGAGGSSERFGAGSTAAGGNSTVVGNAASASTSSGVSVGYSASAGGTSGSIAIGSSASTTVTDAIAIGRSASSTGSGNVALGAAATAGFGLSTAIGASASATGSTAIALGASTSAGLNYSIALGGGATTTAANQLVIGGSTAFISSAYIGNGVTNAAPQNFTLNATGGSGTNIAGASLTLAGGQGTGTGVGGAINFQTSAAGASGSSLNSLSTVFSLAAGTGAATFQNTANSTTALVVKGSSGATNLLQVDTNDVRVKVGYGSTAPSSSYGVLHVLNNTAGSADTLVADNSTSTGSIIVGKDNGTAVFTVGDNGVTTVQTSTNNTAGFVVKDSGGTNNVLGVDTTNDRVAIGTGTTAPAYTLDVLSGGADATTVAQFKNAGATSCTVQPGGTGFACSSDARLKTNVATVINPEDTIKALRGVTFNWITDPNGQTHAGFIAQELEQVIPSAVSTDSNGYKVANYSEVIPYLVGTAQYQDTQITGLQQGQVSLQQTQTASNTSLASLDSRVNTLEQKVSALEANQGNANFASLNVSGPASIQTLTVTGSATIANLTVTGNATIAGNLTIQGHVLGNSDTRGTITMPAGQTQYKFTFVKPYASGSKPVVILTPSNTFAPSYRVDGTDTDFTIYFETPAPTDVIMNYQVQQ